MVEPRAVSFIPGAKRAATATTLRGISYVPCSLAVTCYIGPRDAFGARCASSRCIAHRSNFEDRLNEGGTFPRARASEEPGAGKTKETLVNREGLLSLSLFLSHGMMALSDLSRVECFFSLHAEWERIGGVGEIDRLFRGARGFSDLLDGANAFKSVRVCR